MLETALGRGSLPAIGAVAERGRYGRAVTVFPSLTPVCLSSIATGGYPDVHEIPHLVWWHRGQGRLVEYGSSFGAARAAGLGRTLQDTLVGMNAEHLGAGATTVFEALADAGFVTAAVNFTAYRGRTRQPRRCRSSATSPRRNASSSTTCSSRSARGPALVAQSRRRHRRRIRGRRRALARHARRLRLLPPLPLRLRLRLTRGGTGCRPACARALRRSRGRPRGGRRRYRRAASSGTRSWSCPTTGRHGSRTSAT